MVFFYMILFTWALTETINHGDLKLLSWLRTLDEKIQSPALRFVTTPLRSTKCPFCFSHWAGAVAAVLAVFFLGTNIFLAAFLWLPAVRVAQLFNDLTWGFNRTGRSPEEILDGLEHEDIEAYFREYVDEDRPAKQDFEDQDDD